MTGGKEGHMSLYDEKHRLFKDYIRELERYKGAPIFRNDEGIRKRCEEYMCSRDATWKNIYTQDGSELAGFLIIGKSGGEKHPDADYSVSEAYIVPQHRHNGLMSSCVFEYLDRHPGVYSLTVCRRNTYAIQYWTDIFMCAGYKSAELDDDAGWARADNAIQLAFRPGRDAARTGPKKS